MTATEARKLAFEVSTETGITQYNKIKNNISSAAKAGRCEVTYYDPIKDDVIGRLEKEGYTLKEYTFSLGEGKSAFNISW